VPDLLTSLAKERLPASSAASVESDSTLKQAPAKS
jgi:hypothetical protein